VFRMPRPAPFQILLAAVFLDLLGYGLVVPLLPLLITHLGGNATQIGLLIAGYALLQGICGPLLGMLSDSIGRRPMLLLCLAGSSIGYLVLGLADSLEMLLLALGIDAITGANLSTAQAYLADTTKAEQRSRAFGLLGVAFGLGMTAGPALAGTLSGYGIGVPALVAAAMAGINLLVMLVALPESLPSQLRTRLRISFTTPTTLLREAATLHTVLVPILGINMAVAGLQSIFPLYSLLRFQWNAQANGIFFAFVGICAILTQALLIGLLRTKLSDLQLARLGAGLMLALPLVGYAPAAWILFPLAALIALGSNLCIPALASMLTQNTTHAHGQVMGLQQVVINTALVLGPLSAGLSYDQISPTAPFVLAGIWVVMALVAVKQ
jgi:MFS transporter, DHA1 family, tetracycline resistance protein